MTMTYNNEGHLYQGTCMNVQQIKLLYQVSLENTKFEKIAEYSISLFLYFFPDHDILHI